MRKDLIFSGELTSPATGMSCNKCVAKVESGLSGIIGVTSVSVDLDASQATVKGQFEPQLVESVIEALGYHMLVLEDEPGTAPTAEVETESANSRPVLLAISGMSDRVPRTGRPWMRVPRLRASSSMKPIGR